MDGPTNELREAATLRVRRQGRVVAQEEAALEEAVVKARAAGCSWQAIADCLGVPLKTAWFRFHVAAETAGVGRQHQGARSVRRRPYAA